MCFIKLMFIILFCLITSFNLQGKDELDVLDGKSIDFSKNIKVKQLEGLIPFKYRKASKIVMKNKYIYCVISVGSGSLYLVSPKFNHFARISYLKKDGASVGEISQIVVKNKSDQEVVCDVTFGSSKISISLSHDKSFIRLKNNNKEYSFKVSGDFKIALRPDFFSTDDFFLPELDFFKNGENKIPVKYYLMGVINKNNAIIMATLDKKAEFYLSRKNNKIFDSIKLSSLSNMAVGFMEGVDSFVNHSFHNVEYKKNKIRTHKKGIMYRKKGSKISSNIVTWKYLKIKQKWIPPFKARWYTIVMNSYRSANDDVLKSVNISWPHWIMSKKGPRLRKARSKGLFDVDKRTWHGGAFLIGGSFNGRNQLEYNLEERFGQYPMILTFPLARFKDTPDDVITVVDFIRESLGDEGLKKVMDTDKLKTKFDYEKGKRAPDASCGASKIIRDTLKKTKDQKPNTEDLFFKHNAVKGYFKLMTVRSDEYLAFCKAIQTKIEADPIAKSKLNEIKLYTEEIIKDWNYNNRKSALSWPTIEAEFKKRDVLFLNWSSKSFGLYQGFRNKIVGMGNAIDSFVCFSQKELRLIHHSITKLSIIDPSLIPIAVEIRGMVREMRYNRLYMEDALPEAKIDIPFENPIRLIK